jgi:hypothetical protein
MGAEYSFSADKGEANQEICDHPTAISPFSEVKGNALFLGFGLSQYSCKTVLGHD